MESGEKKIDAKKLRAFHDQIYQDYQEVSCGDKNVLFKMKELWCYLGTLFPDKEKQLKKIRKAEKLDRYEAVVEELLSHNYIDLKKIDAEIKEIADKIRNKVLQSLYFKKNMQYNR